MEEESDGGSTNVDELPNSTPISNLLGNPKYQQGPAPTTTPRFSTPVTKWGITYDGSASGLAVENFLFRIEHLAKTNQITWPQLVNDLPILLRGIASEHYWLILERQPGCDWPLLKSSFLHRFQDRRTDVDIMRLIDSRKQQPRETFLEFYYNVLKLALPLRVPLSEIQTVEILRKNMRVGLQVHLAGREYSSMGEFVSTCVATEDTWRMVGVVPELTMLRRSNPLPRLNELEGNVSYYQESSYFDAPSVHPVAVTTTTQPSMFQQPTEYPVPQIDAFHSKPSVMSTPSTPLQKPPIHVCWNCRKTGHIYTDCDSIRVHIFCYGCGAPEVLKPHCPNCNRLARSVNFSKETMGSNRAPSRILTRSATHASSPAIQQPTPHYQ